MPVRIPPKPPKLSLLEIDVDKDWNTKRIENLGAPTAVGHAFRLGDEITDAMHGIRGSGLHADSHALDHRGRQLLQADVVANRPAAGTVGRIFYATDQGIFYYDNGTAWVEYLRAETASRLASLAERAHSSLTGIGADDHHPRAHDHSNALDGSPIAVAGVPDLPASKITSGRFPLSRMPDGTLNYVIKGQGAGVDPIYGQVDWGELTGKPSTFPPSAHKSTHAQGGADEVVGIALQGTTLPTAGVAGRFFIKTDTLELYYDNGTTWVLIGKLAGLDLSAHASRHASGGADVVSLDASQVTSGRFPLSRMPDGATAGQVLTAQGTGVDPAWTDPLTAADVWNYTTRTLTQTKFPFWSAIITQNQNSVSLPASAWTYVDIQPPTNETWEVEIAFVLTRYYANYTHEVVYYDYNGTTARLHSEDLVYSEAHYPHLELTRILTNSFYARLGFNNGYTTSTTGYYGYSGYKLSQPLWNPKHLTDNPSKPWKKPTSLSVPSIIAPLQKYAYDILDINPDKPNDYDLGIILEEDTPLAVDPATNFPVERLTSVVRADILADYITKFKAGKADPVATGHDKYLKRWKAEGISLI